MHLLGVETNIQHLPSRRSGVAQPYSSRRSARIRELPQPRHHRFWKCVSTDNHDLTLRTVRHDHAGRTRREYHQHELPLESASTNRGSFPSAHPRKPVCLRWLRAHALSQVLRIGYTLSAKSGFFAEACREWRKIRDTNKTMEKFQALFTEAEQDRSSILTTSSQAGEHAGKATAAIPTTPSAPAAAVPPPLEHALAMARVQATANATQAQLATLIAAMKTQTRNRQNNSGTSYCWTHGHTTNSSHTSASCQKQADGHKVTTTKTNTMGGSTHVYGC